jgi:hypothetical protein
MNRNHAFAAGALATMVALFGAAAVFSYSQSSRFFKFYMGDRQVYSLKFACGRQQDEMEEQMNSLIKLRGKYELASRNTQMPVSDRVRSAQQVRAADQRIDALYTQVLSDKCDLPG